MAKHQYKAIQPGYVDGDLKAAGDVFTTEFLGLKREEGKKDARGFTKPGKIVMEGGKPVRVPIDDPSWVERLSKAEAAATKAATDQFPDDPNFDDMGIDALRAHAATLPVDVSGLKSKKDIVATIKAFNDPQR